MNFSKKLKDLRLIHMLVPQNLADFLGISVRAYRYYESGEREPNLSTLMRLADFYGISVDTLIGHETLDTPLLHRHINYEVPFDEL